METNGLMLTRYISRWWIILLRGLSAIALGLLTIFWPAITLTIVIYFIAFYLIIDGALAAYSGLTHRTEIKWWGWLTAEGFAGIVVGIISLIWPQLTALALLYLVAFWALMSGISELISASHFRKHVKGEWLMVISGLLSIAFGIILILWPGGGLLALTWLIGLYALIFGIILSMLSFRVRRLQER